MNNAGIMAVPKAKTVDGFESQMGTNHLGHYALTGLLLPTLLKAPEPRVVTVSSTGHRMGRIDFDDLFWERQALLALARPTGRRSWPTCCSPASCNAGRWITAPG